MSTTIPAAGPMRILVVHPGAASSTADVHQGLVDALQRRRDVEVAEYALGGRLVMQGEFLTMMYRRALAGKSKAERKLVPVPSPDDTVKRACRDLFHALWAHQADWLVIVSGMYVHPDTFAALRWLSTRVRVGLLLTESPYDDDRQANVAALTDLTWTNERTSVGGLRLVQPRTTYLPHAWQLGRHEPRGTWDQTYVPAHDVVFVGTGFPERIEWLTRTNWSGIDLALYGNWREVLPRTHPLWRYVKRRGEPIPNGFAAELYRSAAIGLNLFRQSMGWGPDARRCVTAESLNPRAYELAACGAFQICDHRPEVAEVFGDLVPTFDPGDPRSLGQVVRRWLKDAAGRQAAAAQLPARVAAHTWDARVAQMIPEMRATPARAGMAA